MGMRMIPIGARSVQYLITVFELLAFVDNISRVAVHLCGHVKAMPMDDAFLRQFVGERYMKLLSLFHANGRAQIGIGNRLQCIGGASQHCS